MSEIVISASAVKELREQTGVGMMDCKKALTEAEGDFEKAIELLRLRGQKMSEKRAVNRMNLIMFFPFFLLRVKVSTFFNVIIL